MKQSIYNTFLDIEGRHSVIFNAVTKKYILIKDNSVTSPDQLDNILTQNPKLYNELVEVGIMVEDELDETAKLEADIREACENRDTFLLNINPTLDCNFHCWYCYENHVPESRMSPETITRTKAFISKVLQNQEIKSLHLSFFGGEPLLGFEDVAKELIEYSARGCEREGKEFTTHFTSNGYLLDDKTINWLSQYICGFQITLDGGEKDHDKTRFHKGGGGSFRKIVDNIVKLAAHNIQVIVRVNYTDKNVGTVRELLNVFNSYPEVRKEYLRFDFQRVWQNRSNEPDETESLIQSIREEFRNNGYFVSLHYLHQGALLPCYGDKRNHRLINFNGEVFGCTARDFVSSNRIGVLNESGEIEYDGTVCQDRLASKFAKPICKRCRIAPLCGGSCTQKSYELRDNPGCTLGFTEKDKDNTVINIIDWSIGNR